MQNEREKTGRFLLVQVLVSPPGQCDFLSHLCMSYIVLWREVGKLCSHTHLWSKWTNTADFTCIKAHVSHFFPWAPVHWGMDLTRNLLILMWVTVCLLTSFKWIAHAYHEKYYRSFALHRHFILPIRGNVLQLQKRDWIGSPSASVAGNTLENV